jgi:16S rRNA processing protein RimM
VLLEVGRITKPHGLRGEVLVAFSSDRTDRLSNGSVLLSDRGALTVVSASRHQDRWIVQFEEILDRTEAETWRGVVLRGQALDADDLDRTDPDELWVHELIGCSVELPDGSTVGEVEAVQANPAADLLVLDGGALVPVVFVTGRAPGRIVIDPPEGLLDL